VRSVWSEEDRRKTIQREIKWKEGFEWRVRSGMQDSGSGLAMPSKRRGDRGVP
jgi:hypothetical protein